MKKLIIILIGIATAIPAICQTRTTLTYIANDSIDFVSVITMDRAKLPRLELIVGQTREYHFSKGQNWFPVVVTAPNDPTKTYYIEYTLREEGGVIVPPPDPPVETETILDGAPMINGTPNENTKYSGIWTHRTGASWTEVFEGKSASFSANTGATVTISFTGHRIQWFSEMSNNKGTAIVSIDNGTEIAINLFAANATPPNVKSMVFDSSIVAEYKNLPQGPHTFKIRIVTPSILHDAIKVFSK